MIWRIKRAIDGHINGGRVKISDKDVEGMLIHYSV